MILASTHTLPQCLSIAGSDSGGGAGIQADLKAFHALRTFGLSVVTSVTAQNTQTVTHAHDLPLTVIRAQLEAVFADFEIAAIKTGMLSSADIVAEVAGFLRARSSLPPLVVDPVMIAKSGFALLSRSAIRTVKEALLPLATLVTPNRHEAELLSGLRIETLAQLERAGKRILEMGPRAVLIKGGHLEGDGFDPDRAVDYLFTAEGVHTVSSDRFETTSTHGTGCTYSAAICARLASGADLVDAVTSAKRYVAGAIRHGLRIGHGHGPTDHFWFLDREAGNI